jgi:hypothetical protein
MAQIRLKSFPDPVGGNAIGITKYIYAQIALAARLPTAIVMSCRMPDAILESLENMQEIAP